MKNLTEHAASFVGIPFRHHGRTREGCDCWGLVRLVYREWYGIELPDFSDEYASAVDAPSIAALTARETAGPDWIPVDVPDPGDVVLLRIAGNPVHVGIVVEPGRMLHTLEGIDAMIERYDTALWQNRVIGFYRHRLRVQAVVPVSRKARALLPGAVSHLAVEGSTVADIVRRFSGTPETHFAFVDDLLVPVEDWETCTVSAGQIVTVGVRLHGGGRGGGGKDVTRTVAVIAVMAAALVATIATSGAAAPYVGAGMANFLGGMAGMTVAMAGNFLINTLIPPPTPKQPKPAYDIRAMSNRVDPYGAVTRIFGKHRVYPKYAALPYTELVGTQDQYLRCLFLIGKGRYALSEFKIGDTAISGFEGVEIEQYYTGDSTYYRLFPDDVNETPLSIELQYNTPQTRTTGMNTQEITVELTFPVGLYRISSSGDRRATSCSFNIEYATTGSGQWRNFVNFVRLNLSGTPSTSIAVGQTATTATGSGTVRYVHQTTVHQSSGGSDSDGRPIFSLVTYTDYVLVEVSSGTFSAGQTVTFGGSYTAVIASVAATSLTITEENGAAFKRSFTIKVPTGQYDVRVTKTSADQPNEYRTVYWTALRSVNFSTPVTQTGLTLVGLRIKATSQLNGVLDQFNCVAEALVNAYDGSSWNLVKTRNPAWAFVEVLCGSSSPRPVSTTRLNLAAIRAWALRCEANNWNFDAVIDSFTTVWDLLRKIAAVGRATPGMTDNKYTVIEDVAQTTPVQHFSPRNTWGFSGSRVFPDIPHGLRIRFYNEQKDYQEDERLVFDDGYNEGNATLYETVEFFGVTNPNHIWQLGRYHLACMRLRPETYQFNVDVEHLVATRGDLVRITHDVMLVGLGQGRVKSISTTSVSLDETITMESGKTYGLQFRRSDGSMRSCTLVTSVGTHPPGTVFTISPPMNSSDLPAVGDLAFFGESGSESMLALVTRIDPGTDLTARLTCVPYNSAIYSADQGTIPSWQSQITLPPPENRRPPKPSLLFANYEYRTQNLNEDGTYQLVMVVGFDAQTDGFTQAGTLSREFWPTDVIQGFQAQYREDDGNWVTLPELGREERSFEFPAKNSTSYDIRIRSFSTPGMFSDWDLLENVTVSWTAAYPPNVSGLQAVGGGTSFTAPDLEVTWTAVPGGGSSGPLVYDYKVEVRTSDGNTLLRTEYVTDNRYYYSFENNLADGGPRASVQIRVWARNRFGVTSQTAAQATFTNPAPATPSGLGTQSIMGGVHFYWSASTEKDFKYFQYRIRITSGGTWSSWQAISGTTITRMLTPSEKASYGADAAIYIEVKQTDLFNQDSGSAASNANAGSLNIASTDIADFAVTASKIFTKIPIVDGLTLTNNSPSAGYVSWNAHKIYYNGTEYSISAGNTNLKYIYWYNLGSTLSASNTHPADGGQSGWTPGRDFIIAVNISGTGQQAWNAIANQVIGSAYIMNAAINDAHVNSLSGTKISASSSIAIGGTTYGSDGIQLEYNTGNPRFYAGDGNQQYVKFDGSTVEVSGKLVIKSGTSGYSNISDKPSQLSDINSTEGTKLAGIATGATRNVITRSASSSPPSGPAAGDIWYQTDTYRTYRYSGSSWELIANAYDNTNQLTDGAGLGQTAVWTSISGKPSYLQQIFYQSTQPSSGMVAGDIWINSTDNKMYRYSGSAWNEIQDDQIETALTQAATAKAVADGKIKSWSQVSEPVETAASGTNLVPNGTMEADSNWTSVGTPTSNVRSSTQKYEGTYSRYFTVDAAGEGIRSAVFSTTTNQDYAWQAWVYPTWGSTPTSINVVIRNGANSANIVNVTITGLTVNAWNKIGGQYTETAGGSGAYISFLSPTGITSNGCYVDAVRLLAGTTTAANFSWGDLWFDTDADYKPFRWNGGMWEPVPYDVATWSKITGANKPADNATRNVIWRQSTDPGGSAADGDLWYNTSTAILYRRASGSWSEIGNAYNNTNQLTDGAGLGQTALWDSITGKPADADIYNEYAYRPPNLCHNASFDGWPADNTGIGWAYATYNLTCTYGCNYNSSYSLWYATGGGTTPYIYQNGIANNQSYYAYFYTASIPVEAGKRYCVSCYTGAHRCTVVVSVSFYDVSGNILAGSSWNDSTARNEAEKGGGNRLDLFKRCYAFATAPANTAYARVILLKFDTYAGQTNSFGFFAAAALQEVGTNQTICPPWGPSNQTIIDGGYIRTEVLSATRITTGTLNGTYVNVTNLNASNITAGTLSVDRINAGSITYTKLTTNTITTYNTASGTTSCGTYITRQDGNDKVLVLSRSKGAAGSGTEGSCSTPGSVGHYVRRTSTSGTIIGTFSTSSLCTDVVVEGALIDAPGGTGAQYYYNTPWGSGPTCKITLLAMTR